MAEVALAVETHANGCVCDYACLATSSSGDSLSSIVMWSGKIQPTTIDFFHLALLRRVLHLKLYSRLENFTFLLLPSHLAHARAVGY